MLKSSRNKSKGGFFYGKRRRRRKLTSQLAPFEQPFTFGRLFQIVLQVIGLFIQIFRFILQIFLFAPFGRNALFRQLLRFRNQCR